MMASYRRRSLLGEQELAEQRHRSTQLRDARRYLVAHAHHISDLQVRGDLHVNAPHLGGRRVIEVPGFEIAMLDDVVALRVLPSRDGGHRFNAVVAVLQRRQRDGEPVRASLSRPREGEADGLGRRRPSRGELQRQAAAAALLHVVQQLHTDLDLLGCGGQRHNRDPRRYVDRHRGNDHQLAQLVAIRQVGLAASNRRSALHGHTFHEVTRPRGERRFRRGPVDL